MLEFELPLSHSKTIGLVKHHPEYCCLDPSSCPDLGRDWEEAAARLLAGIIGEQIDVSEINIDERQLRTGWHHLTESWPDGGCQGSVARPDAPAPALVRSVAIAFYRNRKKDFLNLATLFYNRVALEASVLALALKRFPHINARNRSPED